MSVFIIDHDEVIYDVIPSRKIVRNKPPKYPNYLDLAYVEPIKPRKYVSLYGIMGPPETLPPDPSNFLRKNQKVLKKEKPKTFVRDCNKHEKIAALEQKGLKLIHKDTNFIKYNIKLMSKKKPSEPKQLIVDSKKGDKKDLSILEPKFIYSTKFGKSPKYLLRHIHSVGNLEQYRKDSDELKALPNCRYITRQEREDLLNGLKRNWEEKQKEFQLLPMITDTIPKRNRKVQIEAELKVLEKDISLIEKHPYIYLLDE